MVIDVTKNYIGTEMILRIQGLLNTFKSLKTEVLAILVQFKYKVTELPVSWHRI